MVRRFSFMAAGLLLLALLLFALNTSTAATATTSGTLTGWDGNAMLGASYTMLQLDASTTNPKLTVQFSGIGSMADAYCGVTSGVHYPPTAQDQYAWAPKWGWDMTHAQGTTTVTLGCTTKAILVAVMGAGSPTLSVPGVATSTPVAATATVAVSTATTVPPTATTIPSTATSAPSTATTVVSTATTVPSTATATTAASTATTIPPTATTVASTATTPPTTATATGPTATPTAGDGGSTCGNLGDGNVDQNGISVDVWAPGKRTSCAGQGYENGDNPMPVGTHLPAPRPFRFDSAVVMHESPFGFKVFYRPGSEAPAGYGGTGGCGDVRVIMHQGGSVTGMNTQFHTYQVAIDKCDAAGNHHILDVAGRINTGCLDLRSNDPVRCDGPDRLTADTVSCNGTTTFICATVWYSFGDYTLPGGNGGGWNHYGFLIENPITLYDVANPTNIHLTGNDGSTTMLRDFQFWVPSHTAADWYVLFNTVTQQNEVVSAGTAGAWQNHVDLWYSDVQVLEPASGTDHHHDYPGIVFPN